MIRSVWAMAHTEQSRPDRVPGASHVSTRAVPARDSVGGLGVVARLRAERAAAGPCPGGPRPAVAAAAAPASTPAAAPAAAPVRVRMGTQTSVNDIAMWLGAERGYFQEEGIDLDLVPFSNASEMVPALATDQLEAG